MAAGSGKEDKRSGEALKMLAKYPGRLPVICIKAPGCGLGLESVPFTDLPEKKKFLVPSRMSCDGLRETIRKHIKDTVHTTVAIESIHLKADGAVLESEELQDVYDRHKAHDCFLYISFSVGIPEAEATPSQVDASPLGSESPSAQRTTEELGKVVGEAPAKVDGYPAESRNQNGEAGEAPVAETGATTSQHESTGPISSSGTLSVHLPDNDPEVADDLCAAAQIEQEPLISTSVRHQGAVRSPRVERDRAVQERAQMPSQSSRHGTSASSSSTMPAPQKPVSAAGDEASRMIAKFPGRVPVFCKRGRSDIPNIARSKFLVPGTMLCSEFKYMIHRQVRAAGDVGFSDTIYLFLDNISPKTGASMAELYARYKKEDNYLHITYSLENTLGCR